MQRTSIEQQEIAYQQTDGGVIAVPDMRGWTKFQIVVYALFAIGGFSCTTVAAALAKEHATVTQVVSINATILAAIAAFVAAVFKSQNRHLQQTLNAANQTIIAKNQALTESKNTSVYFFDSLPQDTRAQILGLIPQPHYAPGAVAYAVPAAAPADSRAIVDQFVLARLRSRQH